MISDKDLNLIGMMVVDGLGESPYSTGDPVCYNSSLKGGYCLVLPPSEDYYFARFERLLNGSILVPSLFDYLEEDLLSAAASSAVWTSYSTSDVPSMITSLKKEVIMKTSDSDQFFWLTEPKQYDAGVQRMSFLRKDIADLLNEGNSKELFSEINVNEELHKKGLVLYGQKEKLDAKEKEWEKYVLQSYDVLLAKFLQTGEGKERLKQLSEGALLFCYDYCGKMQLRKLCTLEGSEFEQRLERIAAIHYEGDIIAIKKDLEQFKSYLFASYE